MTQQCSELFERTFDSHGGGCLRECACGRTYFDISDNGWTWEDGELERLEQRAKEEPEKYIPHDGTVCCMEISGASIVVGCVCDIASKYEHFIISNDERIVYYLRTRAAALREKADKIDIPAVTTKEPT